MKNALALLIGGMLVSMLAVTAFADTKTNQVRISYEPPENPAHRRIYKEMKKRRVLEKLQEFFSPVRLPRTLDLSLAGCDGEADAFYDDGDGAITICYEYIDELWKSKPAKMTATGVAPIDTVIGPLFDTSLHEFAHAMFDMLKLPLFGGEEYAADALAAYTYLQFGPAEARRLIIATGHAYMAEAKGSKPLLLKEFADEHGTPAQRAYNVLCIAYGADPKLFGDIVEKGFLPKERAEFCEYEYNQVQYAFETLVRPHLDDALVEKVLDQTWLPKK